MEWFFKKGRDETIVETSTKEEAIRSVDVEKYGNNPRRVICCDCRHSPRLHFSKESEYKKVLILGSHITEESEKAGLCYTGVNNQIWKILAHKEVFNNNHFVEYVEDYNNSLKEYEGYYTDAIDEYRQRIINLLCKYNVVFADVIGFCKCTSSSNKDIIEDTAKPNDKEYYDLQSLLDEADIVVINGRALNPKKNGPAKKSEKYFFDKFKYTHKKVICVASSSKAFANLSLDEKAKEWGTAINK